MSISARLVIGCAVVGLLLPLISTGASLYYFQKIADLAQGPQKDAAQQAAAKASQTVVMIVVIAIVSSLTLGYLMGRSVSVPIRRLTAQLRNLRLQQPGTPPPAPPVNDELRELWQAVQDLTDRP